MATDTGQVTQESAGRVDSVERREQLRERYGLTERGLTDRMKEHWTAYLFILLPMIAFASLFYWPILRGFWLTLHEVALGGTDVFVGLENYQWLITNDLFVYSVQWTAVFVASVTAGQLVFGLLIALLVNELRPGLREWSAAVLMAPYFCAPLVGGVVWMWFLHPQYGVMGRLFMALDLSPIYFLSTGIWPYVSLIVAQIWHDYAYAAIIYAAALKSIPRSQYEAAAISGASVFRRFRDITMPHLVIPTVIILAIRTAWNIAEFAQPFALTGGGPGTKTYLLSILVYEVAFVDIKFGRAYTVGITMLIISLSMAIVYIKLIDTEGDADMYL